MECGAQLCDVGASGSKASVSEVSVSEQRYSAAAKPVVSGRSEPVVRVGMNCFLPREVGYGPSSLQIQMSLCLGRQQLKLSPWKTSAHYPL